MKKLIVTIAFILVITIVACGVIACKEKAEETQPDNTETVPSNMHTVTIDTVEKFNHYFTYETRVSEPYYGDTITSTITVTSKLKGFVEYSGEVLFSASSEKEDVSEQVLKERKLSIDSYGDGEDVYELTKDSRNPISFSEVSFDVKSVNITATYHYEGASGNSALSYQRVSLTNYNYKEYVTLESTVNSNDENPIKRFLFLSDDEAKNGEVSSAAISHICWIIWEWGRVEESNGNCSRACMPRFFCSGW